MHLRNRSQKVELLRSVPLFAPLSKRHVEEVAKHADELHFEAGRVLAEEGGTGRELFVIAKGKASVVRNGQPIATLGPGDFIGEMALLDGKPRSATVTAEEPVVALVIGAREFKPLLESVPAFAEGLLKSLAGRLRAADEAMT